MHGETQTLFHLGQTCSIALPQGYKVVGLDARQEPIDLAKSLKYPPDLVLDVTKAKPEDCMPQVKALDPEKAFEGFDGES